MVFKEAFLKLPLELWYNRLIVIQILALLLQVMLDHNFVSNDLAVSVTDLRPLEM